MAPTDDRFLLSDLLRGHQKGFVDLEVSNLMRQLTAEVTRLNKKGSLTITFRLAPQKTQDGDTVMLAIDHSVSMPKADADPSLYFVGDDNRPQKRSPRQPLEFGEDRPFEHLREEAQ